MGDTIIYIWTICALFNMIKIMQSFTEEWRSVNWGIYPVAIILAPIVTFVAFFISFIIKKWD